MKCIKPIVLFIAFSLNGFFCNSSLAQATCFIRFSNLELLKSGSANSQFLINGVLLKPDSLVHEIYINEKGFDSVGYTTNDNFGSLALAKFRAGETYSFGLNPCSDYNIWPNNNAKMGRLTFRPLSIKDTLLALFDEDTVVLIKDLETDELITFAHIPSAMCLLSPKSIEITESKKEPKGTLQVLAQQKFHYLHGEIFEITFIPETAKMKFKIIGYLKNDGKKSTYQDYLNGE